ncbi:hypothetical protein HN789_01010 [archaeon]|jgi:hypothetical protein|nr:hypothetical protein [archaeon]MBT4272721.1 hypothetical protein [archaeon]MBT4461520.1 hypothetical protein [archaeon]MBT4857711.1 hypothetical protein [archaeon]MBT5423900.1 hypothetical protein [archaeon]
MKLLITYFTDRFSVLEDHWAKGQTGNDEVVSLVEEHQPLDLGGRIDILDWDTKTIERTVQVRTPFGADYDGENFFVTTGHDDWLNWGDGTMLRVYDRDLKQVRTFSNPNLADVHDMSLTEDKKGLLISSSGLDLILGTDLYGNTTHTWYATDHGFKEDQKGRTRTIEKEIDHRKRVYMTPQQTTHVNGVFEQNGKHYATLWVQGAAIEIDPETGEFREVVTGLTHPHSFLPTANGGYIVSDTRYRYPNEEDSKTHYGRVLLFDDKFQQTMALEDDFCWVQDARVVPMGKDYGILVADSNNHRINLYDMQGKKSDTYQYDRELKIATMTLIDE